MGILCCKKKNSQLSSEIETEPEVSIPLFKSNADKEFKILESKYNLFKEIAFTDFVYSLSQFSLQNATLSDDFTKKPEKYSCKDEFYKEGLSIDLFQSFIENKIFKHPNLYTAVGNNETLANTFKDAFLEVHKSLGKKLLQSDKEEGKEEDTERVKKGHLIAIGLLYCGGSNVSKIRIFFDLFSENNALIKSDELKDFLLALFLIPAYCMLYARNKCGKNSEIGELEKETMKKILDACELKDSKNLANLFYEKFFETPNLNYDQFKELCKKKDDSLGFLFTPQGVRKKLEENNV